MIINHEMLDKLFELLNGAHCGMLVYTPIDEARAAMTLVGSMQSIGNPDHVKPVWDELSIDLDIRLQAIVRKAPEAIKELQAIIWGIMEFRAGRMPPGERQINFDMKRWLGGYLQGVVEYSGGRKLTSEGAFEQASAIITEFITNGWKPPR